MKPETKEAIDNYSRHGLRPGSFLYAVLTNCLFESFGRADPQNKADMGEIVRYILDNVPVGRFGTYVEVEKWIAQKQRERELAYH